MPTQEERMDALFKKRLMHLIGGAAVKTNLPRDRMHEILAKNAVDFEAGFESLAATYRTRMAAGVDASNMLPDLEKQLKSVDFARKELADYDAETERLNKIAEVVPSNGHAEPEEIAE